jgi:hypothetical protein
MFSEGCRLVEALHRREKVSLLRVVGKQLELQGELHA